ncbi:hypothetical protein [Alloprevotella tannerae]
MEKANGRKCKSHPVRRTLHVAHLIVLCRQAAGLYDVRPLPL